MKKFLRNTLILATLFSVGMLSACNVSSSGDSGSNSPGSTSGSNSTDTSSSEHPTDENDVSEIEVDSTVYDTTLVSSDNGTYTFDDGTGGTVSFTVTYSEGTDGCYTISDDGSTLTFSGLSADSVYSISGTFYGNIVIDASDDYEFELSLTGLTLTSYSECPLYISSGDKVTISAKKDTDNYIYDMREDVSDEEISASIYALCDLDIQGKGNLYVKSVNNNGIHTKDDLDVKNLTLQVECEDNALKGNDSVTVQSGNIVLIARTGDGIKTTNSDVSSKGNQRGTVTICGGEVLIYAACDGIDAAYNVDVNEDNSTLVMQIYTDKYSEYSEEVTATSEDIYYIRYTSTSYKYSIRYFNSDDDEVWYNSSSYETVTASGNGSLGGMGGMGGMSNTTYYYYSVAKPSGYSKMQVYVYSSSQTQGQAESYTAASDSITVNDNYDTLALTYNRNQFSFSWTNYSTSVSNGMGGMVDSGNTDKGDYSTKGIKAANEIDISAGTITISSYDDCLHANNETELENGETATGNITISGGTLYVYSNDDGIHGDGTVVIAGGTVTVGYSYEGVEGSIVQISGGTTSVIASDDGINGTGTSGESIVISGGYLYVYAAGDAVDSNSTTSKDGMLISGGYSVLISTGASDSSIDTENGYKYTNGYVLGMDSGGMTQESTNCSNFSSVGVSKTRQTLTSGNYLTVSGYVTVKLPVSISGAFVVFLGSKSASISSSSSSSLTLDSNGVCWSV